MSLWTPAEISTALWLDAADASSFTLDGSLVSQWSDKSGNSRHAATNGESRPTKTGNSVVFAGSPQVLWIPHDAELNGTTGLSVFVVASSSQSTNNTGPLGKWSGGQNSWVFQTKTSSSPNGVRFNAGGGASGISSAVNDGTTKLFSGVANPASSSIQHWVDGGGTNTGTIGSLVAGTSYVTVGALYYGGGGFYVGAILEVILCSSALSDADRQTIEGYLAHKWGVEDNLPAEHPYKDSPPTIADPEPENDLFLLSSSPLGSTVFRAGQIARISGELGPNPVPLAGFAGTFRTVGDLSNPGTFLGLVVQPISVLGDLQASDALTGRASSEGSGWTDAFVDAGLYDDRVLPVLPGYGYEVDGAVSRTPMQSGRIRQRQLWKTWRHVITCRFELSHEQYAVAENFIESFGYDWFTMPVVTAENGGLLQVENVRVIEDPQTSLLDDGESMVLSLKLELFREEAAYEREIKYEWSFDDGLQGWTGVGTYGTLGADGQVSASPSGGDYAYASTDDGVTGLGLSGVGGLGSPTTGSALYSPLFTVNVADVLTFYLQLVTSDGGQETDYGYVRLLDADDAEADLVLTMRSAASGSVIPGYAMPVRRTGILVTTPASVPMSFGTPTWSPLGTSSGTCREFGCGRTGWVKVDYVFKATGSFKLEVAAVNWSRIGSDQSGSQGLSWVGTEAYTAPAEDACDFTWFGQVLDTSYQTGLAIDGVVIR